jgi:ankyrin repeat protein
MKVRVGLIFTMLLVVNINSVLPVGRFKNKNASEWAQSILKDDLNKLVYKDARYYGTRDSRVGFDGKPLREGKISKTASRIIKYVLRGNLKSLKNILDKNSDRFIEYVNMTFSKRDRADDLKNSVEGWSLLMFAIRAGQPEVVKFLVESGVNKDIDVFGISPISLAREYLPEIYEEYFSESNGFDESLFIPEDGENYGYIDRPGSDAVLYNAILDGDNKKIGYLVDVVGVDIEAGYNGITPLARAALDGKKNIVIYLLRRGANPRVEVRIMDPRTASYKRINLLDAVQDNEIKNLLLYPGYASDERYLAGEINFSD